MSKFVNVAGLVFSVDFPSFCDGWSLPDNYAPFMTYEHALCGDAGGKLLFSLDANISDEPDIPEAKILYDGISDKPEMPLVRVSATTEGEMMLELAPSQKSDVCAYLITDRYYSCGHLHILDRKLLRFALDNALMIMYSFASSVRGALEMHASVVVFRGRGYMFLGKSGTGKSTHSRLWIENIPSVHLLNDDNPIVRTLPDGTIRVYGSPWSGKTPCYVNDSYPLGAVVRLRQSDRNHMVKMGTVESYASLYSSVSGFKADERIADGLHDTMEKLVTSVPCYLLDCLPDREAALLCNSIAVGDNG